MCSEKDIFRELNLVGKLYFIVHMRIILFPQSILLSLNQASFHRAVENRIRPVFLPPFIIQFQRMKL